MPSLSLFNFCILSLPPLLLLTLTLLLPNQTISFIVLPPSTFLTRTTSTIHSPLSSKKEPTTTTQPPPPTPQFHLEQHLNLTSQISTLNATLLALQTSHTTLLKELNKLTDKVEYNSLPTYHLLAAEINDFKIRFNTRQKKEAKIEIDEVGKDVIGFFKNFSVSESNLTRLSDMTDNPYTSLMKSLKQKIKQAVPKASFYPTQALLNRSYISELYDVVGTIRLSDAVAADGKMNNETACFKVGEIFSVSEEGCEVDGVVVFKGGVVMVKSDNDDDDDDIRKEGKKKKKASYEVEKAV